MTIEQEARNPKIAPEEALPGVGHESARVSFSPGEEEASDDGSELMTFALILWQRRWWVFGTVLFLVVVAAMQLRNATPIYQASVQIRYESTSTRMVNFGEIGRAVSAQEEFNTQVELIRGPHVTRMVLDALGYGVGQNLEKSREALKQQELEEAPTPIEQFRRTIRGLRFRLRNALVPYKSPQLRDEEVAEQNRINALRARIRVSQIPDTKLIHIFAMHTNPREAARIANAYAEQYKLSVIMKRNTAYDDAQRFYTDQIKTASNSLKTAERELLMAGGDSELQLLEQEEDLTITRVRELQQRVFSLDDQIAMARSSSFSEATQEVRELLLEEDPEVAALRSSIENLQLERVALAAENLPGHPDVIELDRRIVALEDHLTSKVMGFESEYEARLKIWENEREALIGERLQAQLKMDDLQARMIDYRIKQRAVQEQGRLYDLLLSGFSQVSVTASIESENIFIEQLAVPPSVPAAPKVGRTLILHGMLGAFLGCLLALGLNMLDRSMRDPGVVQTRMGLSNLGIVPFLGGSFIKNPLPGKQRSRVRLITEFDPYSNEAESFRLIRTSLQYSTAGKSPQIIMITSAMPSEGKTTACANLAISYAGLGEKTLLVDADLKLPSIHRVFGIARTPGLSDVLTGHRQAADVIVPSGIENLDVLPAGPDAPNPVELLESVKMDETLATLRTQYRHILMDAPPLYGMSDSYVLATRTDGICIMASLGKTRMDVFRRTIQSLNVLKIRILGIVFNNQIRNYRGSGQYGYYNTPGGGYGYMRRSRGKYARRSSGNSSSEA